MMEKQESILIVDDEEGIRKLLNQKLSVIIRYLSSKFRWRVLNMDKNQEIGLIRRQQGIDPSTLMEITEMQERVRAIKEIMDKGCLQLNKLGFFDLMGDKYIPVGFNPWRDTDGKMDIGKLTDMTDLKIPGTDIVAKSMTPQGILEATPAERNELLKKNWRGILQLFDIHVTVSDNRIEIRGLIPP